MHRGISVTALAYKIGTLPILPKTEWRTILEAA
jgi:hypothetical protein